MVGEFNRICLDGFFENITGRFILNVLGATVRWIYGSVWRTIFRKKKFTYKEYLYGPENSEDWFDQKGHTFVNIVIGMIFLMLIIMIISSLDSIT